MSTTVQRRAITRAIADLLRDRPDHHDCRAGRGSLPMAGRRHGHAHHRIGGKPARSGGAAASSKERGAGCGPVALSLVGCWDCSADTQGGWAPVTQRRAIIGDDDHDPAC